MEREAKLLAAVSHPNIAAIHSLEEANGIKFPVLELVEGETLDQRLRSGRIKVDEALELARQIASALEAAHEQGIIHRDLKPANIKLTPTGQVKVLDFGLAKALEVQVFGADVSDSPTESVTIMGTRRGSIVGTAAYMSPEQAKGQEADRRADIWSFGCVLYEMLTGRRPFMGDTVSDTIAGVLEREPDWDALSKETPRAARRVLRRCLTKDPDRRLHDIADARIELEEAMAEPPGEAASEATTATPAWRFALPWALTATVVIAALWLGWGSLTAPQRPMNRLAIEIPLGTTNFAVSPNGQDLVFQATAGGLYHRPLGERADRSIAGAERGSGPVFSPDGRSILFFADGELKQVSLAGGEANSLADVSFSHWAGLFWGPSGDIVLANAGDSPGLWSLPAAGGTLTPIPEFALESDPYLFPTLIPGSHVMLAARHSETLPPRVWKIVALDLDAGTETDLGVTGSTPRYAPSGHLVFARYDGGFGGGALRRGSLWAVGFDRRGLVVTGSPVRIVDEISVRNNGLAHFGLSADGSLFYSPAQQPTERSLVWVTREGDERPAAKSTTGPLRTPRLSPDETRVVYRVQETDNNQLWIVDLERDAPRQLTTQGGFQPDWSHDGEYIYYGIRPRTHRRRADFSGDREDLDLPRGGPLSISPNGDWLLQYRGGGATPRDVWMVALTEDLSAEPLLATDVNEDSATFSPDGRWIAYAASRAGEDFGSGADWQIFVREFPRGTPRFVADGGAWPLWSRDGSELFYRSSSGMMMAVSIDTEPDLRIGTPHALFPWNYTWGGGTVHYAVAGDGRFLMLKEAPQVWPPQRIDVDLNWFEWIRDRMPTDGR